MKHTRQRWLAALLALCLLLSLTAPAMAMQRRMWKLLPCLRRKHLRKMEKRKPLMLRRPLPPGRK